MLMVMPEFNIAFAKAKEITEILSSNPRRSNTSSFVSLDDIISAVKQVSHYSEIYVNRQSFSQLLSKKDPTYGAMLSTTTKNNPATNREEKIAHLIINSDHNADMQRFSVAHELGHLITDIPNFTYEEPNDGKFTLSAHVNPDITFIPDEDLTSSYLVAEQVANIFALLVLIPRDIKIRDLTADGIDRLTREYGVTEDAIYSRMLLSNVKTPINANT